jgi:hypothetical protein
MMSSQFNYELDERQIRIMMQDAELEYNEAMWHKFDQMSVSHSKSSVNISSYIPKINLSISRSVIVPVLFIVLIGGLSAMLFSFVDFKKKEAILKEVPYVAPTPTTTQTEVITKPIIKNKENSTANLSTPAVTDSISAIIADPVIIAAIEPTTTKTEEPVQVATLKTQDSISPAVVSDQKKEAPKVPVKKKKKIKPEILPIINAVAPNLNEGASEPELDLK